MTRLLEEMGWGKGQSGCVCLHANFKGSPVGRPQSLSAVTGHIELGKWQINYAEMLGLISSALLFSQPFCSKRSN